MPRKASNYQNGVQYKIVCNDPAITDCYNGSCVSLKDRKKTHKKSYTNPNSDGHNFKVYRFIRENGGWSNWTFIQLELYPCNSKPELVLRERYWFDLLKPTLNTYSPTFDVQKKKKYCAEYYVTNKAEFLAKASQYYDQNKDEILEKNNVKVTCECGCTIRNGDLPDHKKTNKHLNLMARATTLNTNFPMNTPTDSKQYGGEYYVANKAKMLAKAKQQYEQNKTEILARQKQKVTCECGCVSTIQHLPKHQRTQKHLALMAKK
jgi:hypothetical protein